MENELHTLAVGIKGHLARLESNAAEWAKEALGLCVKLAEARAMFPGDPAFGRWFAGSGIALNPDDRAAAIAIGQNAERARDVLAATKRRSLRLIYKHEFYIRSDAKVAIAVSEKRALAFAAYDRIKEAGEPLTLVAVAAEAGVSNTVVRAVFTVRQTEEEIRAREPAPPVDPRSIDEQIAAFSASLPPTQRKKFDTEIARFKKHLVNSYDDTMRRELQKWKDETGISFWLKQMDETRRMLESPRNAVMWKAEYNTILRCLHPDTGAHRTAEERAEAFRLFTHYKLKFINDEEERENALRQLRSNMPKTLAEMLARRTKKTA